MRTNIEIDARLLADAQAVTGERTVRGTIEEALWLLVRLARQKQAVEDLRGLGWEGDLDAMREGWFRSGA